MKISSRTKVQHVCWVTTDNKTNIPDMQGLRRETQKNAVSTEQLLNHIRMFLLVRV